MTVSFPDQTRRPLKSLTELAEHFENLVKTGEFETARILFSNEPLALWFGIPTDRLTELIGTLIHADPHRVDAVYAIHVFIQSAHEGRFANAHILQAIEHYGGAYEVAFRALQMYGHRIAGRPVEAFEGLTRLSTQTTAIQPFVNSNNGWPLFSTLQRGITAMLAGDNHAAQASLEEAKLRHHIQQLSFLSKDAWAKSALLHAMWGDPHTARAYILRAQEFPHSGSWAEDALDAHISLAEVLLDTDAERALQALHTIDLHNIGELWPFYVYTVFHAYQRVGARSQIEHRLQQLQSLPFPREEGQGFTGSVFPLTLAIHELFAGRGQAAKDFIQRADSSIVVVQLTEALIETYTGNPKRALHLTEIAREHTVGLRQLDLMRLAIEATAYDTLDDEQGVLATLTQAMSLPRALDPHETLMFPTRIRALGHAHVPDWPTVEATTGMIDLIPAPTMHLTDRELDVLRSLRHGLTRGEMAERLFVSVNTVKTQLNSLYRKLKVSSREEALLAADRLGLK